MAQRLHLLTGKNPYGDKFPQFTNELIREVDAMLGIVNTNDRKNYDDVFKLDIKLMEIEDEISEDFVNKYLLHFIAYVGEILITETNGHWVMDFDKEAEVWEPNIKMRENKVVIVPWVYDGVFNDEVPSLSSVCYIFLNPPKLSK